MEVGNLHRAVNTVKMHRKNLENEGAAKDPLPFLRIIRKGNRND
jgi:hypothetical protein